MFKTNDHALRNIALGSPSTSLEVTPREPFELPEKQVAQMKHAFDFFDTDKRGFIEKDSVKYLLKGLNFDMTFKAVRKLVADFDPEAAKAGFVDFPLFLKIVTEQYSMVDPIEDLKEVFALFDKDSTGKISFDNLRDASSRIGQNHTEEHLKNMIEDFDEDKDGELSLEEFLKVFEHEKHTKKISVPKEKMKPRHTK